MIRTKISAGVVFAAMGMSLLGCETESQSDEALVSSADFNVLAGDSWRGSLIYLDYTSNTEKRIPVEIRFDEPGRRNVVYRIKYPGEAQHNSTEKLKWSRDGRKLNGETIVSRSRESDSTIVLITQYDGKDNERPAEIRMTYSLHKSALAISKDVRFADERDFFRRNTYELIR